MKTFVSNSVTFWLSNYDNYKDIPDNFLCISLSKDTPNFFNRKNAIIPYDGIFSVPNILIDDEYEKIYYTSINDKMRRKGFNGFNDYLNKLNAFYSTEVFHNEDDKIVYYKNIVFMYNKNEDNRYIELIIKLFKEFGVEVNVLKINKLNNSLF